MARRRKLGRPPKPEHLKRTHQVPVRVTRGERERIEQLAAKAEKSVSAYLRDLGLAE